MGPDRLDQGLSQRAPSPDTHREGDKGRPAKQGACPATPADPFVQRQGACRAASDGESRQEDAGRGRGNLDHPGPESSGHTRAAAAWVSNQAASAGVYRKAKQEAAPLGYPRHEGPRHAGPLPAGAQPDCGDHRGRELLRFSSGEIDGRRHRAVFHCCSPRRARRNGFSKATSPPVSTESVTTGS